MKSPRSIQTEVRTGIERFILFAEHPAGHDFLRQRQTEMSRLSPKRIAKGALLMAYDFQPHVFSHYLRKPFTKAGFEVIGVGSHATVLEDGPSSVLKLYRATQAMDEQQLALRKQQLEQKQASLLQYMGKFVTPQVFFIDTHPVYKDTPLLMATQERVNGTPVNLTEGYTDTNIQVLLESSLVMHDNIQSLPDVIGANNIIATTEGERIIDAIPLVQSDPEDATGYPVALELIHKAMHSKL